MLFIALQNSTELAFKEGEDDSVGCYTSIKVTAFSIILALYKQELSLQRNIFTTCAHPLSHPPKLETEAAQESETPVAEMRSIIIRLSFDTEIDHSKASSQILVMRLNIE